MEKQTGQTKDVGFQFGVRKTFSFSVEEVWAFMFSNQGLKIWLGELDSELELKKPYKTQEEITGVLRVFKAHSHVRMTWKKKDWENTSTLQVRTIAKKGKTTISFHQEHLLDALQRKEMKDYWSRKMKIIEKETSVYF